MARRLAFKSSWLRAAVSLLGMALVTTLFAPLVLGHSSQGTTIARGAGTTIIEGGTGSPGFIPVFTTLAFHAEQDGGAVTGDFECFARVPPSGTGTGSATFTVNAMYGTGDRPLADARDGAGHVELGDVGTASAQEAVVHVARVGVGFPWRLRGCSRVSARM